MLIVDIRVRVDSLMVDSDESGAVTADLTVTLSTSSCVALDQPLTL